MEEGPRVITGEATEAIVGGGMPKTVVSAGLTESLFLYGKNFLLLCVKGPGPKSIYVGSGDKIYICLFL